MRTRTVLSLLVAALIAAGIAATARAAAPPVTAGPTSLGTFSDWTAATYKSGEQTVCYAFTRPAHSSPGIPGRGEVLLTVTQRPGSRDEAAVTAGFAFAKGASASVSVGDTKLDFYTSGDAAFARDGAAAVHAFKVGLTAVAHSPDPGGKTVDDTFSLRGFSDAYEAIVKACPGK